MKPIKLSELALAMGTVPEEYVTRIDVKEGRMISVERAFMSAVKDGDEKRLGKLPAWQLECIEDARKIVEGPVTRFIDPPTKFEFHEYRHMELFIATVQNEEIADALWRAIKGKGAFRYFKNTLSHHGLLDAWFAYRNNAEKEYLLSWAKAKGVEVVEDTPPARK